MSTDSQTEQAHKACGAARMASARVLSACKYFRRHYSDVKMALFILLVATALCGVYLATCIGEIGLDNGVFPHWFVPSVMVACGKGYSSCDMFPALDDFLQHRRSSLSRSDVPSTVHASPVPSSDFFHQQHRYLFYSVGFMWRFTGISWWSIKLFIALCFGAASAALFCLFRLGMNPLFSLVGAALSMASPVILYHLPSFRDFAKTPFIFGALFLMGYLAKHPLKQRQFCTLGAILGIVLGLGCGFRQDLMIYVPPALAAVAILGMPVAESPMRWRVLAAAAFLISFVVADFPILKGMRESPGGSAHFVIQGMTPQASQMLGIRRASYDYLGSDRDTLVDATVYSYAVRANKAAVPNAPAVPPFDRAFSPEEELAGRAFLFQVLKQFPADFITRWYASCLQIAKGTLYDDMSGLRSDPVLEKMRTFAMTVRRHFEAFGTLYVAAVLLVLSLRGVYRALVALLFLLYFTGYTSLEFQLRHSFQWVFLPLWALGFLTDRFLRALCSTEAPTAVFSDFRGYCHRAFRHTPKYVARVSVFVVVSMAMLLLPLYAARAMQYRSTEKCLNAYQKVELLPLEMRAKETNDGWTVFSPTLPAFVPPYGADGTPQPAIRTEYLAVETKDGERPLPFKIVYEEPPSGPVKSDTLQYSDTLDFSCSVENGTALTWRYFFPVYEFHNSTRVATMPFAGFAVPKEHEGRIKAFYAAKDPAEFGILLNVLLPSDIHCFRRTDTLPAFCYFDAVSEAKSASAM